MAKRLDQLGLGLVFFIDTNQNASQIERHSHASARLGGSRQRALQPPSGLGQSALGGANRQIAFTCIVMRRVARHQRLQELHGAIDVVQEILTERSQAALHLAQSRATSHLELASQQAELLRRLPQALISLRQRLTQVHDEIPRSEQLLRLVQPDLVGIVETEQQRQLLSGFRMLICLAVQREQRAPELTFPVEWYLR